MVAPNPIPSNWSHLLEFTYYRGRVGMFALLKALGVKKGDDVAIQAFTCVAVPEGVIATGARPIYIDIEKNGVTMDAESLRQKLTPNTKAIVVQHTFGVPTEMDSILKIANEFNIPILEDCCHTLEGYYKGKRLGTFGKGAFYSWEWGKPVIAGIGGSIAINDVSLIDNIREHYSQFNTPSFTRTLKVTLQYYGFGFLYSPKKYWFVRETFRKMSSLGIMEGNYNPVQEGGAEDFRMKMNEGSFKRLNENIERIKEISNHSTQIATEYTRIFENTPITLPKIPTNSKAVFNRFPIFVKNKKDLLSMARQTNIELADWYNTPIHPLVGDDLRKVFYEPGECPNAEYAAETLVSLPTNEKVGKEFLNRFFAIFENAE